MASITIRNLDDDVKTRLRIRAAGYGCSMEEEVRLILREAVERADGPTIRRKPHDAMHGSLYRFDAVRVTIIATLRSSKGTEEAAFAGGAAPITLIDGDKLIDLQIEHGIGVRKRTLEVLTVDRDTFADLEGVA